MGTKRFWSLRKECSDGSRGIQAGPIVKGLAELRSGGMALLSQNELEVRAVSVHPAQLVLLMHFLEASEGLGFIIAKRGGDVLLIAPKSQSEALDDFICDMKLELGLVVGISAAHDEARSVAL